MQESNDALPPMPQPLAAPPRGEPLAGAPAPVIAACGLGKCYHIYENHRHRLRAALNPWSKTRYHEFWALRDVSFEVRPGEAVGILGRNGSGKSTLLQLVAGILRPSEGEIAAHGRVSALLELGSGFNPEFTGRENVYLNGSVLGISARRMGALFDSIAAFADIGPFIDQPVKTYSSGMMIRLAFAVAVAVEPDILIVDEALAVGDIAFQRKCFRRVEELRERGMTLLWVTHDPALIRQICSRALVLDKGRVAGAGPAGEMADLYLRLVFGGTVASVHAVPRALGEAGAEEGGFNFDAAPAALRYDAAEHEAGVYDPADRGAYNVMPPFALAPGHYRLEVRLAARAAQPKAVEVMVSDWKRGRVAFGANPVVSPGSECELQLVHERPEGRTPNLMLQTLEYDFETSEELDQAEVRVTNLGGAEIQLQSIRLWRAVGEGAAVLSPVAAAVPTRMRYFNGRAAVPFTTVPVPAGGLARVTTRDEVGIVRAAVVGDDGRPRAYFHVGDEAVVIAEVLIQKPIEAFQFGVLLRDKLGQDVLGQSRSSVQCGLDGPFATGDRVRIQVRFAAAIRQDTYFITLGLTDLGFTQTYFYGIDLLQLPVHEKNEKVFGIVHLPMEFAAERVAQASSLPHPGAVAQASSLPNSSRQDACATTAAERIADE